MLSPMVEALTTGALEAMGGTARVSLRRATSSMSTEMSRPVKLVIPPGALRALFFFPFSSSPSPDSLFAAATASTAAVRASQL